MRLTLIAANNIKGKCFSHALHPVTMVIGPNESGKTAILDAIRLLSQDFLMDLRGTKILPAALASGNSMRIHGKTDTGLTPFKNYEKGRLTGGADMPMPATLLDSRAYFGLSGPKRTEFIFNAFPSTETRESVISQVAGLIPDEPSEAWEAGLKAVLEELRKPSEAPFHSWLNERGEAIKSTKAMARAAADRMAKTIEGLASLDELYPVEGSEEELRVEAVKLEDEEGGLREHVGTLKQRATNAKKLAASRSLLPQKVKSLEDTKGLISTKKVDLATAEATLGEMLPFPDLAARIKSVQAAIGAGQKDKGAIEADLKAINRRHEMLLEHDKCPLCEQVLADKVAALTSLEDQILKTEDKLATLELKVRTDSAEARKLSDQVNARQEAESKLSKLKSELALLEERARSLQDQIDGFPAAEDSVEPIEPQILLAETKLEAVKTERKKILGQLEKFTQRKFEEERRQQALVGTNVARATEAACTATLKVLQAMRAKVVAKTFDELVKTSRSVTDGVMCHELAFDGGEIGAIVDGKWVSHDTFSGLQQAVTYLAVCASFASPDKRIVILDEMTRLDVKRKRQFIERVVALVQDGVLSQFIGVDTVMEPYQVHGIEIIKT